MRVAIRWICFALTALLTASVWAAPTPEQRVRDAAEESFRLGLWERAEQRYAGFADNFKKSEDRPLAFLRQAQARIKQGRPGDAIELLAAHQRDAGKLADEYQYWLAEANFANTNFATAAGAYAALTKNFTNSPRQLEAAYGEALAWSKAPAWSKVIGLLQETNGVFQQSVTREPTNQFVIRGSLLLVEAQLVQNDLPAAGQTLRRLAGQTFSPELDWRRQYLVCRLQLASARLDDALVAASNLTALAVTAGRRDLEAESAILRGDILEQLKRFDEAISAYESNLADDLPAERRRQAVVKIVEQLLARNKVASAAQRLEKFLGDHANDMDADQALVMLGELNLKEFLAGDDTNRVDLSVTNALKSFPAFSNHLQQAFSQFGWVTKNFPRSPLAGKALLGRGWCYWANGQISESLAAFQQAADKLPVSADQALARYKWADCLMRLGDFSGALSNYFLVTSNYIVLPAVKEELVEPALYQIVRASLAQTNLAVATNTIGKILVSYPNGFYCDRALLLTGEKVARNGNPAQAREIFSAALRLPSASPLAPEIRLAIARCFEQEKSWSSAQAEYDRWLADYPTNPRRPEVEYTRAWAVWRTGQGAEALAAFGKVVDRYPTNEFAPLAQNWVADYYLQQGNYTNAEANYQLLFQKWPPSVLTYSARLMAGRAAMARQGYEEAIGYFTKLINEGCPTEFMVQAFFEYGDATMRADAAQGEPALTNYWRAISIFSKIPQLYPTNELVPIAWGRIGDCYLQYSSQNPTYYTNAAASYQKALDFSSADRTVRSLAEFGLAVVLEKQAALLQPKEQPTLRKLAFDHYLNIALGENLRGVERADPFWSAKAGLEAIRLAEEAGNVSQVTNLCQYLGKAFPPLRPKLEKKLARAQERPTLEAN